jgi:hypothetical protein
MHDNWGAGPAPCSDASALLLLYNPPPRSDPPSHGTGSPEARHTSAVGGTVTAPASDSESGAEVAEARGGDTGSKGCGEGGEGGGEGESGVRFWAGPNVDPMLFQQVDAGWEGRLTLVAASRWYR